MTTTSHRSEQDAVLAVNELFYRAFSARDLELMGELWAQLAPVAVVHPGWQALAGRGPVLASFRAIFSNPRAPTVTCVEPKAFVMGDVAFVLCTEVLEEGALAATNVFLQEDDAWRMVHHHAGPGRGLADNPESDPTGFVH